MAIDYTMIGKRLKESRMAAKLTQEKVAEAADITLITSPNFPKQRQNP